MTNMITVEKRNVGAFTPENNAEANGEILGRCNALHDWMMALAKTNSEKEYYPEPLDADLKTVCALMGFTDVLAVQMTEEILAARMAKTEKASGANAD